MLSWKRSWLHRDNHLILMVKIESDSSDHYRFQVWTALTGHDSVYGALWMLLHLFGKVIIDKLRLYL